MSKIKNILIFVAIGVVIVLIYVFFFRGAPPEDNLVSTTDFGSIPAETGDGVTQSSFGPEFLTLLLSVKNIRLNDAIFADPAFATLQDSSILLTQDGNEGRPNPFAPIGSGNIIVPTTPVGGTTTPMGGGGTGAGTN